MDRILLVASGGSGGDDDNDMLSQRLLLLWLQFLLVLLVAHELSSVMSSSLLRRSVIFRESCLRPTKADFSFVTAVAIMTQQIPYRNAPTTTSDVQWLEGFHPCCCACIVSSFLIETPGCDPIRDSCRRLPPENPAGDSRKGLVRDGQTLNDCDDKPS